MGSVNKCLEVLKMLRSSALFCILVVSAGCTGSPELDLATQNRGFTVDQIESVPFMASSSFEGESSMTGEIFVDGFGRLGYSIETDEAGNSLIAAGPIEPLVRLVPASSGRAVLDGTWGVTSLENGALGGDHGSIAITIDFEEGTVVGQSGILQINGVIENGLLNGTSTLNGMPGMLEGVIGTDETAGFFIGDSYAGAFAAAQ